ncbi:MAG: hypothetical protein ACOCW3_04455 [Spirochaetota bacterium]
MLALCAVALAGPYSAPPAAAQTTEQVPDFARTAVLEIGPERRRGIDALAPDVTPHWYGRYRVAEAVVDVLYVDAPLERPATWTPTECRERALRASDGLVYHESDAGWSLLVEVAAGELPPDVTLCIFVDRFITRHLLFESLEGVRVPDREPIFPAVIEL